MEFFDTQNPFASVGTTGTAAGSACVDIGTFFPSTSLWEDLGWRKAIDCTVIEFGRV